MGSLLLVLIKSARRQASEVLRSLVVWLAWVVEGSRWLHKAFDDGLQAPCPRGLKRARNISETIKDAVALASSSGNIGRSGVHVKEAMERMGLKSLRFKAASAHFFEHSRVESYWGNCISVARRPGIRMYGIVCDATRMSKVEMLYSAMTIPSLGLSFWLPPRSQPQ